MPRKSSKRLTPVAQFTYEPYRRNPIKLGEDSFIGKHMKQIRIGDKASILGLSEDELKIDGDLFLDGKLKSHIIQTDNDYLDFKSGLYFRFFVNGTTPGNEASLHATVDGDLLWTSAGNYNLVAEGDIDMSSRGDDFHFRGSGSNLDFFFHYDSNNHALLTVADSGVTSLSTVDNDGTVGHLTIFPDGDLKLQPKTGVMYLYDSDNADDYLKFTVGTNGATEIQTYDVASGIGVGYDASIKLVADGELTLHATGQMEGKAYIRTQDATGEELTASFIGSNIGGNKFLLHNRADAGDFFQIKTLTAGATTISTTDDGGAAAHLKFEPDGSFLIKEVADPGADVAGYGQLWIHDTTPNELCFTDDAGTDIVGIGKYQYETKLIGYYGSGTYSYLPINGYVLDQTSTSSRNEYHSFVAPYNGTIQKVCFRSEIAQDGAMSFRVLESSDDTETPGSIVFRQDLTVDIADDTYYELDLRSAEIGDDYAPLTKGRIYVLYLNVPTAPNDTNITVVFKWDITS
tara:strand:+ start:953 stop:2500 length:1548 start_codon:yes stop_codon:yes gene_type:complete